MARAPRTPSWLQAAKRRLDGWVIFTVLRRPRSLREAGQRGVVLAAVIAAAVMPALIGRSTGDVTEGASAEFAALVEEREQVLIDLEAEADTDRAETLRERLAELEAATELGYLEREDDSASVGALIPDFRLLDLEGNPFRLSDLDQPVVLNFWASWCQPCVEEMPDFQLLHEEYGERMLMIGVNDGEDPETAAEFAERLEVDYLILIDPTKQLTDGPYRLIGRPTTYYINAEGFVQDIRVGFHTLGVMRELTASLWGEEPADGESEAPANTGDYTADALDTIASSLANAAVGADLLSRWDADAEMYDDPAWQRNVVAQARGWGELVDRFEGLTPPQRLQTLHDDFLAALRSVDVAGRLLVDAVELQTPDLVATAAGLFEDGRANLESAGEALSLALGGS